MTGDWDSLALTEGDTGVPPEILPDPDVTAAEEVIEVIEANEDAIEEASEDANEE